ncbi:MAG: xanthine dehydrogenase family protein molybdopterin-binding subunit [Acidobacteria bacterium]|nr:xanthine dehydrogenase family protein molybdopterin-binding subunit [Acidobacteriota bacterium]
MTPPALSRRELLKATGGLLVGFKLFEPVPRLLAQGLQGGTPLSNAGGLAADQLDSWLAIAPDGTVSVFTSKVDLGTGTGTALGQIVAEELDVAIANIRMEIGDTTRSVDQGRTSASRTLERAGPQMRQAAAAARQELLARASARLGTPADRLAVADGVVRVAADPAKSISYAALVGGQRFNTKVPASGEQWDLKVAPDVTPKHPKEYTVVGTSVPRFDLPQKFTGEFPYAHEVRVPGMLHGRVVRPPVVNSKPARVDETSIRGIPDMVKVVQEGSFVGVVAQTEWAAIRAARALKVTWSPPPGQFPAGPDAMYDYLRNTRGFTERVGVENGNVAAGLTGAARRFEATYRWPFQMHGMIAPSCAVADVQGDKATIWSGSQAPFITRNGVARLLGLRDENVHFIYREGSGCFGRLEPDDAPEDAALLSRAVGRPVRVQWMRDDEHGWEPKGPPQLITIRSGLDGQGRVTAWDYVERTLPWTDARLSPMLASRQTGIRPDENGLPIGGNDGTPYAFEHRKATLVAIPWMMNANPLRTANLRAPYGQGRCFASESQMDEMAAAASIDPVEFRLRYLAANTRAADVLRAAAERAGWQARRSPRAPGGTGTTAAGRGVAISGLAGTLVAQIADIDIDRSTGRIAVKKITVAHDCGIIVNPDGLRNQIEGNVIQSVSRSLMEEVGFDSAGVKSLDWTSYPIIRFRDIPDVDIVLIDRREMPPFGAGEASSIATAAASANAGFDALGGRLRQAPFTPERVLRALRAGAV